MAHKVHEWLDLSRYFRQMRRLYMARFRRGSGGPGPVRLDAELRALVRREDETRLFFGAHGTV